MTQEKLTFCRICEPHCPLFAHFDHEGQITHLTPCLDHPSGGVACHKGLAFLEIHNDPDRLNWPQKRLNPKSEMQGDFVEIGWDEAMNEIAPRLTALRETHGPNSVAIFMGNANFNAAGVTMGVKLPSILGTKMMFSSSTQDLSNKFAAARAIYGSADSMMVPDIYNTDYLLCLGTNPKVSRWTMFAVPNNWDRIKDIKQRGGKMRFVNPRKTESSSEETGPTTLIRPGTDVYFLAAVINEIQSAKGIDDDLVGQYGKNIEGLQQFVTNYPAERVSAVTGVSVSEIKEVASEMLTARSAAVYMSVGVNQSRQGVLCFWLVEMLNFITGNLGRKGGTYRPYGLMDNFQTGVERVNTSVGSFDVSEAGPNIVLPSALLPELIENGEIRALIVLAGNPILSVGGGERARRAYEKLDTLIVVDIFRNATGELADYVLPAADWLERADINIISSGLQPEPYVQHTDAMVQPGAGRRNEWWIVARLAQALGTPSPLDQNPEADGSDVVDEMLASRGLSAAALRQMPWQSSFFPQGERDSLFERCVLHSDKRIDCFPQVFVDAGLIERCARIFAELSDERPNTLKLISLRTPYLHNSWWGNMKTYRRGKNAENPLHMREDDAERLGLFGGDRVNVATQSGQVTTQILIDNDLCSGTVAMSHGFGHERSFSLTVAKDNPGANSNSLMPIGRESIEPLSYMSWISGIPVRVEPAVESGSEWEFTSVGNEGRL